MLANLSVVRGIRLPGDHEYLADADIRNHFVCDDLAVHACADLHLVPTMSWDTQFRTKPVRLRVDRQANPISCRRLVGTSANSHLGEVAGNGPSGNQNRTGVRCLPLKDLIFPRRFDTQVRLGEAKRLGDEGQDEKRDSWRHVTRLGVAQLM
jgi:hypothetical protein